MSTEASASGGRRNKRIGKYEIVRELAVGGMGKVYRAVDTDLQRDVALKVLLPELASRNSMLKRFRREAQLAAKLRHENVVSIYEIGEADGKHYLALEYVDGIDLNEYISRKGRLDPEEARQILIQATKALSVIHKHGLVHRDIKPSNFLITRKGNHDLIKLTDLGLAREVDDEAFKVTRAGTTVGTVDYMAPEQARNSRAADIRSDIYSLGCTLFHMLTGKPPFAEGGLTERMYKHVAEEVPDVCKINPKVSPALAAVLYRMMEKKPESRYQTPEDLLQDLVQLEKGGANNRLDLLASLARDGVEDAASSSVRRRTARPAPGRAEASLVPGRYPSMVRRYRKSERRPVLSAEDLVGMRPWWPYAAVVGAVLVVVLIAALLTLRPGKPSSGWDYRPPAVAGILTPGKVNAELLDDPPLEPPLPTAAPSTSEQPEPQPPQLQPKRPAATPVPPRTNPSSSASPATPSQKMESVPVPRRPASTLWVPGMFAAASTDKIFRVGRMDGGGVGEYFPSLTAACEKALAGQETIIEIHDNGPFFVAPVAVHGKSLRIRPGPGYRPLLAWEVTATNPTAPGVFLAVSNGNLTLEHLDLVVKCPDTGTTSPRSLVRVIEGDLLAWGCTFSVARAPREGVAVVHYERTGNSRGTCRLQHCFLRGRDLIALDLRAPGTEVRIENCLVVGGGRSLLEVRASASAMTDVQVVRSTFVGRHSFLRVRPVVSGDRYPAFQFVGQNTLISRAGDGGGGELLILDDCAKDNMKWQPHNCLYAGWQTLLGYSGGALPVQAAAVWRDLWKLDQAEPVSVHPWPASLPADPCEIRRQVFESEEGQTGCDLNQVPPGPESWLALTYEQVVLRSSELAVKDDLAPSIPLAADGLYHGERLNVHEVDLGKLLRDRQAATGLGPRVVLHLVGSGKAFTSPIQIQGSSLVLHFEQPRDGRPPLELAPPVSGTGDVPAFIDVQGGDLEMYNARLSFPNTKAVTAPRHVLRVRGGHLRLARCRLTGPLGGAPDFYRGLIAFAGSDLAGLDPSRQAWLGECVLASGRGCLQVEGSNAQIQVHNCVFIAAAEAFTLNPGPPPDYRGLLAPLLPHWNLLLAAGVPLPARQRVGVQCLLERNTFALRGPLVRLKDGPDFVPPLSDPYLIQARANLFVTPFADGSSLAGLLLSEGQALCRGLLVWQGEANAFDKRLHYRTAGIDKLPGKPQPAEVWVQTWGSPGERNSQTVDLPPDERKLELDFPKLEALAFPSLRARFKTVVPGSDLPQVAPIKRPAKGSKKG